jgi:hypothetical protein
MTRLSAALAALTLAWAPAEAMDYAYHLDKGSLVISATGDIREDESRRFLDLIATLPLSAYHQLDSGKAVIVLDSLGGQLQAALTMAHILSTYKAATSVAANGQCASACVVAWAAGVSKSVGEGARVGVHSATLNGVAGHHGGAEDQRIEVEATGVMARFFQRSGAPANVITKTYHTPSSAIYWLTDDEIAAWKVKK